MSFARRAVSSIVVALVVTVIVVAALGAYVFAGGTTTGQVVTSFSTTSTVSTNSTTGLDLALTVNSTVYSPGQWVSINITEYNTLSTNNTLQAEHDYAIQNLSLGPCSGNLPIAIGIFRGDYTLSNISQSNSSEQVNYYKPGAYPCPAIFYISQYTFLPHSDNASWSSSPNCGANCFSSYFTITDTINFNGTWTGGQSPLGTGAALNNLSPGTYTVVGGDEWGNIELVHFEVSA